MDYIFIYPLSAVLGLIIGSFLNVVIYRTEKDKKFTGRSFCPKCKKQILWYDNVPLLSFLLLRGRCRFCRRKISAQYPIVEMLTGLAFLAAAYLILSNILNDWLGHYYGIVGVATMLAKYNLTASLAAWDFYLKFFELLFLWIFFSILIVILVYDFKNMLIPDSFTIAGIIAAAVYGIAMDVLLFLGVAASNNQNFILAVSSLEKKQNPPGILPFDISSFFTFGQENFYSTIVHWKSFFPASGNLVGDTTLSYAEHPWQFIYSFLTETRTGSGLIAALVIAAIFFLIVYLSQETWMGMGDVKLVFFLGLLLGIFKAAVALFLAFEIGAVVGIVLILSGRAKMKTALPFGPFLILGAVLSLIFI